MSSDSSGYKILYEKIRNYLSRGMGFSAGKMGSAELNVAHFLMTNARSGESLPDIYMRHICINAGLYPPSSAVIRQWNREFINAVENLNCIATWIYPEKEEGILKRHGSISQIRIGLTDLEPYYWPVEYQWTRLLSRKRVLVISPFTKSIEKQIPNLDKIWERIPGLWPIGEESPKFEYVQYPLSYMITDESRQNPDIYPPTSSKLLTKIEDEMRSKTFDIALIGVGANSLPLCNIAKKMGKIGIHLGGALQILFGIRGARWDDMPFFMDHFNEFWKYPDESETPAGATIVEAACYWKR